MSKKIYDVRTGVTQVGVSLKKKLAGIGLGAAVIATGVVVPMMAHAAPTTVVVSPSNTQGWSTADTRTNGSTTFVADATAPLGTGALSLKTTNTTPSPAQDKAQYLKDTSTNLVDLTAVSYWTKQNTASFVSGLPSFQLPVCLYGVDAGGCVTVPGSSPAQSSFTTLVYEPYVDQGNAAVLNGVWQQWDVAAGKLWSSKTVAGLVSTQGSTTYTLAQLKADYPQAVVFQFGVNVGSNNPFYDTEVDGVRFNDTTYDFELVAPTVSTPVITSPANNSTLTTAQAVKIDWTDSVASVGGAVTYNYQAYSDTAYTSLVYGTTGLTVSEIPTPNTPAGVYYVRVQAVDANGNLSAWSNDVANPYKITISNAHTPVVLGSKDDCKNNGWKTSELPVFKNQGDCVSFFASNKSKN